MSGGLSGGLSGSLSGGLSGGLLCSLVIAPAAPQFLFDPLHQPVAPFQKEALQVCNSG